MSEASVDPDLERRGREEYELLRVRIRAMKRRALAVALRAGGMLAREDDHSEYSPLSRQVRWQLQLAAEHLVALDRLVQRHGLPDYAGYVLIRAAIETSGAAYWLLQPEKSDRRVLRALRMAWWNQRDAAEFAQVAGFEDTTWDQERRDYLETLRCGRKSLAQNRLDTPRISHTDMLTEIGRRLTAVRPSSLVAWRLCSGLAHGNSAMAQMSLQHRVVRPEEPRVQSSTSSWALISGLTRTALDTFDAAIALFQERAILT